MERYHRVDVAMVVAQTPDRAAPVIIDADAKSAPQIAVASRNLASPGRGGRLTPADREGATFTVSNLGMFRVTGHMAPGRAALYAAGGPLSVPAQP